MPEPLTPEQATPEEAFAILGALAAWADVHDPAAGYASTRGSLGLLIERARAAVAARRPLADRFVVKIVDAGSRCPYFAGMHVWTDDLGKASRHTWDSARALAAQLTQDRPGYNYQPVLVGMRAGVLEEVPAQDPPQQRQEEEPCSPAS